MDQALKKTQEYLDYIKAHYFAVQEAWALIKRKCSNMGFVEEDSIRERIDADVLEHDYSKLSMAEFVPYRLEFYPTDAERESPSMGGLAATLYREAWAHHKKYNDHHWQAWTEDNKLAIQDQVRCCVHMVVDWVGMAMQRNNPYSTYYREHKDLIQIPDWAHALVESIFRCLEA